MAGNRIDMIERAAARLRRDAPAQKPVIEQGVPAQHPPEPVAAPVNIAPVQVPQFVQPPPDSTAPRQPPQPQPPQLQPLRPPEPPRPANSSSQGGGLATRLQPFINNLR